MRMLLDRLRALLDRPEPAAGAPEPTAELQRAAAVLLMIAAGLDGRTAPEERQTVARLLETRLGVPDSAALVESAAAEAADATDFHTLTRVINDRLQPWRRVEIIEMLWRVVLADGDVHDFEANLIRRISGLLHVSDRDAGEARKRALDAHGP